MSGSGLLMTLEFRALGVEGKKSFRLRKTGAFDATGAELESFAWLGGKAEITVPTEQSGT